MSEPESRSLPPSARAVVIGKALASGADAFLTKPIDFAIVRGEIDMRIRHAA